MSTDTTRELLDRHHRGDPEALAQLLVLHLPAIRDLVHRRFPQLLRRDEDTMDIVQDVAIQVLKEPPRIQAEGALEFRALVARMVANRLNDRVRYRGADRRSRNREAGSLDDGAVDLRPPDAHPGPGTEVDRRAFAADIHAALELLPAAMRTIIQWRDFEGLPYKEIGARLAISDAAARMRCVAAHDRLAEILVRMRARPPDESEDGPVP